MGSLKNGKTLAEAMNVKVVGDGEQETIVLAHGFGGTQDHWSHVVEALVEHMSWCKVVLLDWPGACTTCLQDFDDSVASILTDRNPSLFYGFADLLITLLEEELQIQSCTFVGHSMSAMIGCVAALKCPRLFNKLVLVGASPRYLNIGEYYGGFEPEDLEQLFNAVEADFRGWAAGFAAGVVGAAAGQEAIDTVAHTMTGMEPEVGLVMLKDIFESDNRGVVEELTKLGLVEVHVLQTCNDLAVPLLVSDYFKSLLGGTGNGSCLEVLQTDGHLPHLSDPHFFSSALLRHLT